MTCPHCRGADKIFDQGTAERDLKDYRVHGPGTTTRLLIAALKAAGIADRTLLDIGGGVGVIQHELLFVNLFPRLQRNAFRFFVHPTEAIEAVVRANGLERHSYRKTLFWQVIVYTR